jgi:hypothetical protein
MTTELLALADRVEAASELSRQDLIEIFKAVRPRSSFDTGKETDEARETFVRLLDRLMLPCCLLNHRGGSTPTRLCRRPPMDIPGLTNANRGPDSR